MSININLEQNTDRKFCFNISTCIIQLKMIFDWSNSTSNILGMIYSECKSALFQKLRECIPGNKINTVLEFICAILSLGKFTEKNLLLTIFRTNIAVYFKAWISNIKNENFQEHKRKLFYRRRTAASWC